jgi:hypothetical protein
MIKRFFFIMFQILMTLLLFMGCDSGTNPGNDEPSYVAPPENLVGTMALENGKSAVMTLEFPDRSRGTVGITGNVRYEGDDYVIGGLYNDETGALSIFAENSTGQRFVFSGTYYPGVGFQGTVTLFASDNSVITEGSIYAATATDTDVATIKYYTGSYGGDEYGTWNGTLTATHFYGTYSGSGGSGSFRAALSGSSISGIYGTLTVTGSISSNTATGSWSESGGASGSWSGAVVDSNNDTSRPTSSSDKNYLTSLIYQAYENGYNNPDGNVTVMTTDTDSDGNYEELITFTDYNDPQTGLKINGNVLVEPTSTGVFIYIDSNISDWANSADSGGATVTFYDNSIIDVFAAVHISDSDGSFDFCKDGTTKVWEVGGTDVLTTMESIY